TAPALAGAEQGRVAGRAGRGRHPRARGRGLAAAAHLQRVGAAAQDAGAAAARRDESSRTAAAGAAGRRRASSRIPATMAMMASRAELPHIRRWVVKIGSSLLTAEGRGLAHARINQWSVQIARLKARQYEVVLVSSGAVAEGLARLGWNQRPTVLKDVQAAAAVGQAGLVEAYAGCFDRHGLRAAQILLTHADVEHRRRYLNARNTLLTLLSLGVIPIVNENDTIVTDEIRIGDNDTMAALAANLVDAQGVIILTDQPGVFDADPRT